MPTEILCCESIVQLGQLQGDKRPPRPQGGGKNPAADSVRHTRHGYNQPAGRGRVYASAAGDETGRSAESAGEGSRENKDEDKNWPLFPPLH